MPLSNPTGLGPQIRSACTWTSVPLPSLNSPLTDVRYERSPDGIVKLTIARAHVHNAFRPRTLLEMEHAFLHARETAWVRAVILTGEGTRAFCSGGDQSVRGSGGYVGTDGIARLAVLDLHVMMRRLPKPVIAMIAGYAVGGGHILHLVCDLTIAAENAVFGQTGPKVGSFDGGYGSSYLARIVGQKRAREIWFLCRQYSAQRAFDMGLVNTVVPLQALEEETVKWTREILIKSPTAIACIKAAMNADGDGHAGLSQLAGEATRIYYQTDEAKEGKKAFLEKRPPRFANYSTEQAVPQGKTTAEEEERDAALRKARL